MPNNTIETINSKSGIYYATLNSSLILSFTDKKILNYLRIKEPVKDEILTDFFPELFGLEDEVLDVVFKRTKRFSLNTINRTLNNDIFFNLHILSGEEKDNSAFIIIEDVTEACLSLRKIQQKKNEMVLENNELIRRRNFSDSLLFNRVNIVNYFQW